MKKLLYLIPVLLVFLFANSFAQYPYWHQTNGPEAGTVRDMTIDSAGRLFAWTSGSGVYRSTDSGGSWELFNRGLPTLRVTRGAASRTGFIFVFTLGINTQVFRINENIPDAKWEEITPKSNLQLTINDILCDPKGELYIATSQRGVMRSEDNGSTWIQKNTGLIDSSEKPHDGSAVLLAIDTQSNLFVALGRGTIWKSADKGDTWTELTRDPVRGNVLYALAASANGNLIIGNRSTNYTHGGQIFVSSDGGKSWDSVYRRPATTSEQKNWIDKIVLVPGSNILYANAHGPTLRSTDNGVTWVLLDTNKRGDEIFSMVGFGKLIFQLCEPDGIFLSTDSGANWTIKNKGLIAQFMWGIAINSKEDLFGITEYGLHRSTDNGNTWELKPEYGETYFPSLYINSKDFIYIGTDRGLFRSKDNGDNLQQLIFNFDTSLKNNTINQVGDNGQGKLFCATNVDTIGFQFSTNDGDTWTRIRNLPDSTSKIKTFAFASKDTVLLAALYKTDFYRSIDQGEHWQFLPTDLQGTTQVLIHPDGSYLSLVNNTNGGIFRSVDGAKSWQQIFPPPDFQMSFTTFFSMMIDDKGSIVVCTDSGIYRSATGDRKFNLWPNVSEGLSAQDFPNHFVNTSQVVENPRSRVFFAATRGLGVFKSIPGLGVVAEGYSPASPLKITARPNPFTAQTNISFTLEKRSEIHLNVYDILGKHVQSLFDGVLDQGNYSDSFDGSSLPSGNYLVVLNDEKQMRSVSVTLTK